MGLGAMWPGSIARFVEYPEILFLLFSLEDFTYTFGSLRR